jgi:hypothetical protein
MAPLKTPFWRFAIISLMLWALPLQWLASAANLPCARLVHGKTEVALGSSAQALAPQDQPVVIAPIHGHHHTAHSDEKHAAHEGDEGPSGHKGHEAQQGHDSHESDASATAHAHSQCAGAGHCCVGMALIAPALPDFDRPSAAQQSAALAQQHGTPLLSGPDRPPQTHAA